MSVIEWLLEGDPAIRWQVLRDLTNASAGDVAAERARVEHDGWGARLLAREGSDGLWDGGACFPASYTDSTGLSLQLCLDGLPLCQTPAGVPDQAAGGEAFYSFDTAALPDGDYVFRLTASDLESNPEEPKSVARETSPLSEWNHASEGPLLRNTLLQKSSALMLKSRIQQPWKKGAQRR